ncbi:uncharacterized protein MONOS_11332 [Monocercomonoides exilis]|uniref:uncharacterized protein n=1 Tax=Monocercomonoides exilis TaxID=2049356 RepID=UPI00355A5BA5|nr:hypothetical protein MONOS_11332 [Monocercomonoides exilis]|eukprot:MONOS_11332.1-p1 / transcript=MONOS_11332.1 / gene=MONOS_11332 / organism=Monocercomonoides_exilis_PA203 / gene_product=unspecified product / transcript_product=unspecified product / location=Mono_scaffold00563:28933-30024(-) / protein_length=280 / sequence_SO=supercontig / SO=protein_coding / is_pseudo=false
MAASHLTLLNLTLVRQVEEAEEDSEDEDNDDSDDSYVSDDEDYFDISRSADTSNSDETHKTIERVEDSYTLPALRFPHKQPKMFSSTSQKSNQKKSRVSFSPTSTIASGEFSPIPLQFTFPSAKSTKKMERKKKTRTQLAVTEAEKPGSTRQKTQQSLLGCCFFVKKASCLVCHQSNTRQRIAGTSQSSCEKQHYLKPSSIPSSHACGTGGILENDANSFLSLSCGTRLFSLGGEDTVRDAQLVENMGNEMNVWRGEERAAVKGVYEARNTAELFCEER